MKWIICWGISFGILVSAILFSVVLSKTRKKRDRVFNTFNICAFGVASSAVFMFVPIYSEIFERGWDEDIKIVLLSIHNMIRLFIIDGEFNIVLEHADELNGWLEVAYPLLAAVLFVFAPILTFGVVLSFFKNFLSYITYWTHYFREVYVFSELNEKSMALAKSLKEKDKKRIVIFTDVIEKDEEVFFELKERAKEIGAVTFKRDIAAIDFQFHSNKKKVVFFAIGEQEAENLRQSLILIGNYKTRKNTFLYVFATDIESELLLSDIDKGELIVHRVNEVTSLISRLLYDEGIKIFRNAAEYDEKEKLISAVVVGMGKHGTEMAKALPWFCQMDGYHLEMSLFDEDPLTESKFSFLCPELMDEKHNGDFLTPGEAHYKISIHSGLEVEQKEFWEKLRAIGKVTYVFVALENDEKNIRAAVYLRSWFEKMEMHPVIDAIVGDTDKKKALKGVKNRSGQEYDINFIGDIESSFSEKVILEQDVEAKALERHLKWGNEEDFWKYEYNYRSSIASAIHRKMKIACGIPGADVEPKMREESARWALRDLEHRRWNAYMRTEGYTLAEKRNNMAKTHTCLIPFEQLSREEKIKDDD